LVILGSLNKNYGFLNEKSSEKNRLNFPSIFLTFLKIIFSENGRKIPQKSSPTIPAHPQIPSLPNPLKKSLKNSSKKIH
jgi:hypothetical protein